MAVVHTHWDREWYHPAVRFQARLVALVDAVLAAGPERRAPFLLDGQAIVLADYLRMRPEQAACIRDALARGTLEAGPWYVLADNLLPSGEAIVRNLAAGARLLDRLGAKSPRVAYCPDTFGHPAALPSIARGFGLETAIVWRGFGGAAHPSTDTFLWRAPDGEMIPTFHLPPDGYEFGSGLPNSPDDATARWSRIAQTLGARNHTGLTLLTVGADHHAPPADIDARLALLQQCAAGESPPVIIARSGLAQFSMALRLIARPDRATSENAIPTVDGELRDSYGYTWTLQGTFGTRAHQKRTNARLERRLLHDIEPLSALAWLYAPSARVDGSITLPQLPELVHYAWETLLRTHPHDTLCGCSIDAVAQAMTQRQRDVAALCTELRDAATSLALGHDAVRARARAVLTSPPMVIRNRVAYDRGGIAELTLIETVADVPVGPSSGGAATPDLAHPPHTPVVPGGMLQPLSTSVRHRRRESPQHYPDNDLVREHRVLAWVPPVPAFGLAVVAHDATAVAAPPPAVRVREASHASAEFVLDNDVVQLHVSSRGIVLRCGDREVVDALRLETIIDAGDSYTPSLRGSPIRLSIARVAVDATGPLRGSIRVRWTWRGDARGERIDVDTVLSLDAGSRLVRCEVRGRNRRRNQRLQLIWRTDVDAATPVRVIADAAMGWIERTTAPSAPSLDAVPYETPSGTMPLHRWACVSNADRGATLFSDGLAEGACIDGQLAVTLVRSIGELSRADLPERPGHAGWPAPIPEAQSLGPFRALLALQLHQPWSDRTACDVERTADALLLPLTGESARDLEGGSRGIEGPSLHGDGLVASTVCIGNDGASLVLRCRNVTTQPVLGGWRLPAPATWMMRHTRIDETPLSEWIELDGHHANVAVPPRATSTVQLRRRP